MLNNIVTTISQLPTTYEEARNMMFDLEKK